MNGDKESSFLCGGNGSSIFESNEPIILTGHNNIPSEIFSNLVSYLCGDTQDDILFLKAGRPNCAGVLAP